MGLRASGTLGLWRPNFIFQLYHGLFPALNSLFIGS